MTPTTIYAEATPNPLTMKFVANRLLIEPNRIVEYLNEDEAQGSPLALELFKGNYVKSLFFNNNFITITRTDAVEWPAITGAIREFLQDYLTKDKVVIEQYPEPKSLDVSANNNINELAIAEGSPEEAIVNILNEYIKPAVEQDGGAISFRGFENGIVTVALQGSCSGCPSSKITLKSGIENLLIRMVPGVKEVVAQDL